MFERKKKQAMDSKCHSSMLGEGSYIGSYHSHSKRYLESEYLSTQRKKEKSVFPLINSKALTQGIEKTMFVLRSDSPLNIQSIEIWSSWNIFKKLIWRFYAGVHSCRQESIWSSGKYIFPFLSSFLKLVKPS